MSGKRKPGVQYAGVLSCLIPLALCLVVWSDAHANHESSAQPPLWTPLDEVESMAMMEVPGGMVTVPAGEFIMGSDPRKDPAAGPQEQPLHRQAHAGRLALLRLAGGQPVDRPADRGRGGEVRGGRWEE